MTDDKKRSYIHRMEAIEKSIKKQKIIKRMNLFITGIVYICYPLFLIFVLFCEPDYLYRAIIVPLDSFIILSVFRFLINRKRPYELYGHAPAIHKETKGKSFPSRHVFCVFVIAMTIGSIGFLGAASFAIPLIFAAVILFALGVVLAFIRVYSGVHFISDVIVGSIVGMLSGIIGFWVF